GIADLMQAAGLTHGGFYRQFKSKDDLVAQAVGRALDASKSAMIARVAHTPGDPLHALVDHYVSCEHIEGLGQGCGLPALGSDAGRTTDPTLHAVFADAVESYVDGISSLVPAGDPDAARQHAIVVLAEMVGAVVLARAIGAGPLRDEVVSTVRDDLKAGTAGS
ncbi:MAG: TetR/AcrR family transcriptional regulator, partial [Devosia sp.]